MDLFFLDCIAHGQIDIVLKLVVQSEPIVVHIALSSDVECFEFMHGSSSKRLDPGEGGTIWKDGMYLETTWVYLVCREGWRGVNTEGWRGRKSPEIEVTLQEACGLGAIEAENNRLELRRGAGDNRCPA